jgi:hypothetical protein
LQRVTGSRVTVTGKRAESDLFISIHHARSAGRLPSRSSPNEENSNDLLTVGV